MEKCNCQHEQDFLRMQKEIDTINSETRKYVSWTVFWSIVVLLVGMAIGVENGHREEDKALTSQVNSNSIASATIQTQLTQIQKDILEIKVSLKEHDKDSYQ